MGTCDTLISANCHHVDQPNLTSSFIAVRARTDRTALADSPLSGRLKIVKVLRPSPLFYDNRGAGYLANDEINNHRSKHIDTRFHFIRSWVKAGIFVLVPVASADNLSDIFTKQLKLPDFNRLRLAIMSASPAPLLQGAG
jgi:hypothetical protein